MFEREQCNVTIHRRSNQTDIRKDLITIMQNYAIYSGFSFTTLHLGVYFLDIYMDNYIVSDKHEHQKLCALISLMLAAKSEDLDEYVPSIKDILRIIDLSDCLGCDLNFRDMLDPKEVTAAYKKFSSVYYQLEFLIFESIEFNCIRPTYVSFVNVFRNVAVIEDDYNNIKMELGDATTYQQLSDLQLSANELITQFLEIILHSIDFFNILPSIIAASIICATRQLLKIENYWTTELESFTRHSLDKIAPVVDDLIGRRMMYCLESTNISQDIIMKDSGYISPDTDGEGTTEELSEDLIHCETGHANKKLKLTN